MAKPPTTSAPPASVHIDWSLLAPPATVPVRRQIQSTPTSRAGRRQQDATCADCGYLLDRLRPSVATPSMSSIRVHFSDANDCPYNTMVSRLSLPRHYKDVGCSCPAVGRNRLGLPASCAAHPRRTWGAGGVQLRSARRGTDHQERPGDRGPGRPLDRRLQHLAASLRDFRAALEAEADAHRGRLESCHRDPTGRVMETRA
jgi:hypothetical protein